MTTRALHRSLASALSAAWLSTCALSSAIHAQEATDDERLTWALDPAVDADAAERIEGQTGDLAAVRVPIVASPDDGARAAVQGDPFALASLLARYTDRARAPRVVISTRASEGAVVVLVVDLAARRVLYREVAFAAGDERSAALETVGIIVRGALQTLAEGGEIGVRPPDVAHAEASEAASSSAVASVDVPVLGVDDEGAAERPPSVEAMLGGSALARPLASGGVAAGGRAAFAMRRARLFVALAFEGVGGQRLRSMEATVALRSLGFGLVGGLVAFERRRFALVPAASLNLARARRETTRVAAGGLATPSSAHLDVRLGAGVLLRAALGDLLFLTLDVGVEVPLRRVRYTVGEAAGSQRLGATPRLTPYAGVGLLARVGRN